MPKSSKIKHNSDILDGMARGPWVTFWAQEQEEKGRTFPGQNLDDLAPSTPAWAKKWAQKLADSIAENNNDSLSRLYQAAKDVGFPGDETSFGYYFGMQAVGAGVHWTDDVPSGTKLKILVPSFEFYRGAERSNPDLRFLRP